MDNKLSKRAHVGRFWQGVFVSAWRQTELLSWRKLLTTLGVSIIAVALQFELNVRTLYVTGQIIGTVVIAYVIVALIGYAWNVAKVPAIEDEQLKSNNAELTERLRPRLEITFKEGSAGYVQEFEGQGRNGPERFTLYRVAVTSRSTTLNTRLRVEEARLQGGEIYHNLHLRIMHKDSSQKELRLHAGVPEFWDIAEKPNSMKGWFTLTHTEQNVGSFILPCPRHLRLIASCDEGFSATAMLTIDGDADGNLRLWLERETD